MMRRLRPLCILVATLPAMLLVTAARAPLATPEQRLAAAFAATIRRNYHASQEIVYPSPAYYTPYLRDSFWTAQALDKRRFSLYVLDRFARAERADGEPPTWFGYGYREPRYHDDESAALLLIWAWRNKSLYGVTPPVRSLRHALHYLLAHTRHGLLVTPAGPYASWWDAYRFRRAGTLSYNQGLYALALRCARGLRLPLPRHALSSAERGYRSLFNRRLGYLPVSTTLRASDASALTGEFLSLWLFRRPILTDNTVLGTLRHLTPFGTGYRVVALPPGRRHAPPTFPASVEMGVAGDYQNGASWLLYDALSIAAAAGHGLPHGAQRLRARLALEFRHGAVFHEYLQTDPGLPYYGAEPPYRDYFSWDTFVAVVDRWLSTRR